MNLTQEIQARAKAFPQLGGRRLYVAGKDRLGYVSPDGEKWIDERECSALFVVSTQIQDRDGDVVVSKGCQTANYANNPLWFFGHQSLLLPIGTARDRRTGLLSTKIEERRVLNKIWFDQGSADSMEIFRLRCIGLLNNTSIGFQPWEQEKLYEPGGNGQIIGWKITKWDLLECSIVGVGANPEALAIEINKSCCPATVRKAMEPWADKGKVWINGCSPALKQSIQALEFGCLSTTRPARAPAAKGVLSMSKKWNKGQNPRVKPKVKAPQGMNEQTGSEGGDAIDPKKKGAGTDVQALSLPKAKFPDQQQAAQWVEQQGYDSSKVTDAGDAWVFEQFPLEQLGGSETTQTIADGVSAVVGQQQTSAVYTEEDQPADGETPPVTDEAAPAGPIEKDPAAEGDPNADPNAEAGDMASPAGDAALLQEVLAHAAAHLPSMGQSNPVREFYMRFATDAYALAMQEFPDMDWGEPPATAGEAPADDGDGTADNGDDSEYDGEDGQDDSLEDEDAPEAGDEAPAEEDDDDEEFPPKKPKKTAKQLAEEAAYEQLAAELLAHEKQQKQEEEERFCEMATSVCDRIDARLYELVGR